MALTSEGALKIAAGKTGCSVNEYLHFRSSGKKFCMLCRVWLPIEEFHKDSSRYDGLSPSCVTCRLQWQRRRHIKKPVEGRRYGPLPNLARDGDKQQARKRVQALRRNGRLPNPQDIACVMRAWRAL